MQMGDRVFLWESGGKSRVIGLAVVASVTGRRKNSWRFAVKYETARLDYMPGIAELLAVPTLKRATFLQPGIFRTVYALTPLQASALYRTVADFNPAENIWRDLRSGVKLPDVDQGAIEGNRKLVSHFRIERAAGLSESKKNAFRRKHGGKLFCECCGRDHREYGKHAEAAFEVHHRRPLGATRGSVVTPPRDLAVLCSNCHRVIHRLKPMCSPAKLSRQLTHSTNRVP